MPLADWSFDLVVLLQDLRPHVLPALGLSLAVGVAGLLLWRRAPLAAGDGLFVTAAVSTSLTLTGASGGPIWRPVTGHLLTLLGLAWLAFAALLSRRPPPLTPAATIAATRSRAAFYALAGLICGLLVAVNWLALDAARDAARRIDATTDIALLGLAAAIAALRSRRRGPTLAAVAAAGVLAGLWLPWEALESHRALAMGLPPGAALAALAAAVAPTLVEWQKRRWRSHHAPQRLVERGAPPGWLLGVGLTLSLVAGLAAGLVLHGWLSGLCVLVAAIASVGLAHRHSSDLAGAAGLLLLAEGVVLLAAAATGGTLGSVVVGATLAAGYLVWLGLFWQQQLDGERAWTSTGRLIPATLDVGCALGMAAFAATLLLVFGGGDSPPSLTFGRAALIVLLLAGGAMMTRAAGATRSAAAECTGALLMIAAVAAAQPLLELLVGGPPTPFLLLAVGASLFALRLATPLGRIAPGPVAVALVGGVLPMLALQAVALRGGDLSVQMGIILSGAAIAAVWMAASAAGGPVAPAAKSIYHGEHGGHGE